MRSSYKFPSLVAVADFLIKRVDTTTDWTSTSPTLTLTFDRSIKLPHEHGESYDCTQAGDGLIFEPKAKVRVCEERSDELKRGGYWILTCMVEATN